MSAIRKKYPLRRANVCAEDSSLCVILTTRNDWACLHLDSHSIYIYIQCPNLEVAHIGSSAGIGPYISNQLTHVGALKIGQPGNPLRMPAECGPTTLVAK